MSRAVVGSLLLLLAFGCQGQREIVTVFHAGSLSRLINELADRFESHHPNVVVRSEASGSLDAIRKVTELGKGCDVLATADDGLILRFLVPNHTREYYRFLGNELVVATANPEIRSLKADWTSGDWLEHLLGGQYRYGISDPDRDPAGYYAHLVCKLAEIHFGKPGLYRKFLLRLDPKWLRPRSSELIPLLESGALDFAFIYKSTAIQTGLAFHTLPPQVSLAEEAYSDFYSQVFFRVAGNTPDSEIEITASPIRYGLALLTSDNRSAREFVDFLLSPESQNLYRELGYLSVAVQQLPDP